MKVEMRAVDKITPYAKNPRKNKKAVAGVAAAINEYGFRQPIVVDEHGVIIVGHTRLLAAQQLGMTEVPVHVAADLDETQRRAYRLADNRLNQIATWDKDLLSIELLELKEMGADLKLIGFTDAELSRHMSTIVDGHTDPDDVPTLDYDPISVTGDIWTLGNHRLMCGDSENPEHVAALLDGDEPFLMVTDPPYGVEYEPTWRDKSGRDKNDSKMGKVDNDAKSDWRAAWGLAPCNVAYVWHAALHGTAVVESLESVGYEIRAQIIWVKDKSALSRGHYHWKHEPCWYAVRKGPAKFCGDRSQTTVWEIPARDDAGHGHSTQKPVECMIRPILNHTAEGDQVYDPFVGSGTTIISAQQSTRRCLAMELNPAYVDIAIVRWQEFTGEVAYLGDQTHKETIYARTKKDTDSAVAS